MQKISKRILFIPDLFRGNGSGAVVTQVLTRVFIHKGFEVGVISSEFQQFFIAEDEVSCYPCPQYTGVANLRSRKYLKAFISVLSEFQPTHLFFDGSISNKPICYLKEGLRRNLNITVFIFMQDFFCAKLYANNSISPCTKCLDGGLLSSLTSSCGVKKMGFFRLLERCRTRFLLKKYLAKVSHVGTSTDEQVDFYFKFGIPRAITFKLPLPFDDSKVVGLNPRRGKYFVGIAQNRLEKGFHLIPEVIKHTKASIILAFYNEEEVRYNSSNAQLASFIETGQLTLIASSWKTGLGEIIANAQGVLIPSIWPTTTEFGWLEALSLGKPTITFDIGAHHEYIKNRINGMVSPISDYLSMGKNIDYIDSLSDEQYKVMTGEVYRLYEQLSSRKGWESFADNIDA